MINLWSSNALFDALWHFGLDVGLGDRVCFYHRLNNNKKQTDKSEEIR